MWLQIGVGDKLEVRRGSTSIGGLNRTMEGELIELLGPVSQSALSKRLPEFLPLSLYEPAADIVTAEEINGIS